MIGWFVGGKFVTSPVHHERWSQGLGEEETALIFVMDCLKTPDAFYSV